MTSGIAPVPMHDHVGVEHAPRLADDALHAAVALEARERVAAVTQLDAVRAQHARRRSRPPRAEARRERRVLEHHERAAACRSAVSEAATSQAM